jgi:iron complex outermembrane recepter protein
VSIYGDLQLRNVHYKTNGNETGLVNDTFNFFNPKAGITYQVNQANSLYLSYARAHREPNRSDYKNGSPKPEKLNDFELGWRNGNEKIRFNTNAYFMGYKDQLVLTGQLDNVGSPIRANSGDSYRIGLEIDAVFQLSKKWTIAPNFTVSSNKNIDFVSDVNGTLTVLGNTDIAYSPSFIAGNTLSFSPFSALKFSLLSKFVSEQYMNNIEDTAGKLNDYFVNDFNASYEIKTTKIFESICLNLLINNILNVDYVSNGADYGGGYVYYYPQAGSNFLMGLNLKF